MDDFRNKLIYLSHFPGITWNEIFNTLKRDPLLMNISYQYPRQLSLSLSTNQSKSNSYMYEYLPEYLHDKIRQYPTDGIEVITYFDDCYPLMLKEIFQPPWCLFLKGNLTLLNKPRKLAIVGARQATVYGKNVIDYILPPLLGNDILIVSGLASGIDTLAHEATIMNGGDTIAVIAGGFNHIYPQQNEKLARKLAKEHLIISEYPPDTRPTKWQFPARNRIISGLCEGTIIVEAKRKSGSLITANYAIQEGREVFAVPGSIFGPLSVGTNDLIQQGAKLVMSGEDILSELR
jgi:DNA processing protein